MIEMLDPDEGRAREYVPQAILHISPEAFVQSGAKFVKGHDDLDGYVVAEMRLGRSLPFALFRYDRTPVNETTILLPDTVTATDLPRVLAQILVALGISSKNLSWVRTQQDTPA